MTEQDLQSALLALREALPIVREELRACQAVIHLSGDFDPAYVSGAQAAMKKADKALTSTAELAQQIRDEIERKAKVEALSRVACHLHVHGYVEAASKVYALADELEGRVKG